MATKQPSEIAEAAVEAGTSKAHLRWDKVLVGSFLAGAYIAFGGLVAMAVSSGLDAATWGTLPTFFPIMAFVAMGFDHVVANMFFLPAGIFAGVPGLGRGEILHNGVFAFLGNLVGAVVFVATSYWYLYLRPDPASEPRPAQRGA